MAVIYCKINSTTINKIPEVYEWCCQSFGKNNIERWDLFSTYLSFKHEKDYTMFLLRWL